MVTGTTDVILLVWPSMGWGLVLIVGATGAGWLIGRRDSFLPVRLITWWVVHVIVPLVRSRSWWRRATAIFVNNTSILAAVLAMGVKPVWSVLAVVGLGLSLGIGLRVLSSRAEALSTSLPGPGSLPRHWVVVGVVLNLLEPPAILLTIGLSLGQTVVPLPAEAAWKAFAVWAVPLLLLAAAGEALWLGAGSTGGHPGEGVSGDVSARPPPSNEGVASERDFNT